MTIQISARPSKKELMLAINKVKKNALQSKKPLSSFFGKFKTNVDGLEQQKIFRSEWS